MKISIFTRHTVESPKAGGMETYLATLIRGLEKNKNVVEINKINEDTDIVLSQEFAFHNSKDFSEKIPCIIVMHGVNKNLVRNVVNSRGRIFYLPMILLSKYLDLKNSVKRNLQNAKHIISVSNHIKRFLVEDYQLNPKKITAIHNGVDTKKFFNNRRKSQQIKKILYIGRLSKSKGIETLIKSILPINVELIIVGSGYLEKKLKKNYKKYKKIKFLGQKKQSELTKYYNFADLLVFPSLCCEGCPMTLLEAMSCETPIISSNLCGNLELIKNGENGLLWDIDTKENGLRKKILFAIKNPEKMKKFSKKAKQDLFKKYTLEKMTSNTLKVIEKYH